MAMKSFFTQWVFFAMMLALPVFRAEAQVTGKFGTYYDQRELLFEAMPTSTSDIIFLGNSITDGGEWGELFQNPHCKNRGISGDIIPGVLNRLATVTKGHPAMAFLMIGTNDINHGYTNDSIAQGVRAIVRRIKDESPNTRVIVQSILPTNDCYGLFTGHTKRWQDVALVNAMLKTMTEEEGVDYLDLYRHFATEEGKMNPDYSNDGLHLNGAGYLLWKNLVEDCYGRFPRPVFTSRVPVWLNLSTGTAVVHGLDKGASPMHYAGLGFDLNLGATVEWNRFHAQADFRGMVGALSNNVAANTFDFDIEMRVELLYHIHQATQHPLRIYAGGALDNNMNLRYFTHLMNASVGVSNFNSLQAVGMLQYDFASLYDGAHNLFTLYGKLALPLLTYVSRPGYAYMDNYTSDINTEYTILQNYENFFMAFPGASTDVGLMLNLPNNNKISVAYRWDFLTTRYQGTYRFDRAAHSILTTFMFNIN